MAGPAFRHALIMAAGRGVRMLPLTESLPKAMAPYQGTTLIARGIDGIRDHVPSIHVTVGHHGAMLAQHVVEHGAATVINTEGRGNCWWVYNTFLSLVDEPVLVLTCDNVMDLDVGLLAGEYARWGEPPCMLVPVEPVAGLEGDFIFHDDHVVTGLSRTESSDVYCSGIQVLNPAEVRRTTEPVEDFTELWDQLIAQRRLRSSQVYPKRWFSADTIEQLAAIPDLTL